MITESRFLEHVATYAKAPSATRDSVLFGEGLNMTSIGFTECIMELEEETGMDIDIDDLDASIKTAGQLYDRIFG